MPERDVHNDRRELDEALDEPWYDMGDSADEKPGQEDRASVVDRWFLFALITLLGIWIIWKLYFDPMG